MSKMRGMVFGVALVAATVAQAALTVEERDGRLSVLRDGKVVLTDIREDIGAACDVKTSFVTLADGTKAWNRWCETKDRRFRLEVVQRADGAVEMSIAGQAEYDSRVRARLIRFDAPAGVLDGKPYELVLEDPRAFRRQKGVFGAEFPKTEPRWLAVDGLVFDFNPLGASAESTGSTDTLNYKWEICRGEKGYGFTGSRTIWPAQGCFIGTKLVLREGAFEDFDKYHFFRGYSYKSHLFARHRLAFGAPKRGPKFADGNVVYDSSRGYGWVNDPERKVKTGHSEGRFYSLVGGRSPAVYRFTGLPDGWYVFTVACGNWPGVKNGFDIAVAGAPFAENVKVGKRRLRVLSRGVHVTGGTADVALSGNWIVSSLSVQPLLADGENFSIGRGYWVSDGYEPTLVFHNADFRAPVEPTLLDETDELPEPGAECVGEPRPVPMPVELPDPNAPELAWLDDPRMFRLNVSPTMAEPENHATTRKYLDDMLSGKGFPSVMLTCDVFFQRHALPQYVDRGVEMLKYFFDEMHGRGVKVLDHHDATIVSDYHTGFKEYLRRLPEALHAFEDDLPSKHYCPNNPVFKKTYFDYLRRVVAAGADGFQIDELEFWGHGCTCVHCRRAFRRDVGWSLPYNECDAALNDLYSPLRQRWDDWRRKTITNWFVEFRRYVKDLNPNLVLSIYCTNSGIFNNHPKSGRTTDLLDQKRVMNLFGTEVLDPSVLRQSRADIPYFRLKNVLCSDGGAPIWDWFYNADWQTEYFGWCMSQLAGQTPILFNIGIPPSAPKFREWGATKSAFVRKGATLIAETAVLFSTYSRDWNRRSTVVEELFGTAQALEAIHVPYEFILDEQVEKGDLAKYKAIFVGTSNCLSDPEIASLRAFAERGGTVRLAGLAGTCDRFGNARERWPFEDVFGFAPRLSDRCDEPIVTRSLGKGTLLYSPSERARPFEMRAVEWPHVKIRFSHDPEMEKAFRAEIADQVRNASWWTCRAPDQVYTSIWREKAGATVVQFLNATGAGVPEFDKCVPRTAPEPAFPPLKDDIVFTVPSGTGTRAVAESPDFAGIRALAAETGADGSLTVTLPRELLATYVLIRILK